MTGTKDIEVVITMTVPDTLTDTLEQGTITALHTYARTMNYVVDAGIRHMKAIKLHELLFLWNEVRLAGDVMRRIDPGEVFGGMTCNEVQYLADIFAAAGDQEAHDFIIDSHSRGDDDPEDEHYPQYLKHQEER